MKIPLTPAALSIFLFASLASAQYRANEKVSAATRLDFVYPLANQSPRKTPKDWLTADYDSKSQTYELFLPAKLDKSKPSPCIIFISPSDQAVGYRSFAKVCRARGVILASPHKAGNRCPIRQRVRIVLDVIDDVRRKHNIDPDRTYIGGFSGGARIACAIAFALPESFGGVIPICAGGDLRRESYLRHRVIDRLSVAHMTGTGDFNRGEVELFRHGMLKEVGVRSRVWVVKGLGHGIPSTTQLTAALKWLDEGAKKRQLLAKRYASTRLDRDKSPSREEFAKQLAADAKLRLKKPGTLHSGLMLLKGIYVRWQDLPTGLAAKQILLRYQQSNQQWQKQDVAEQRNFLIARARALDAYATSKLPKQYEKQRPDMLKAAIQLWQLVIRDGQDIKATGLAKKRVPILKKRLGE